MLSTPATLVARAKRFNDFESSHMNVLVYRVFEMPWLQDGPLLLLVINGTMNYNPYKWLQIHGTLLLFSALKRWSYLHPTNWWVFRGRQQHFRPRQAEGLSDVKEQLNAMPLFGADGQMPGRFCTLTKGILREGKVRVLDCGWFWHWFWQISKVG